MRIHAIRDLATTVRGRRRDLGISQAELAARADVSRKWIYEFESGKPAAELQLVLRVLDALGLVIDVTSDEESESSRSLDALIEEHRAR